MTLAPLDFDFALMSPLSRRPPHAVPREEMRAEIEQELADRAALYGRLVDKGKLAAADAARHVAILEAVRDDLDEAGAPAGPGWEAKVRELRRELALRRNAWPKRLARPGDPLTEAAAARRMERLDAVHFLYWIEFFACDFGIPADLGPGRTLDQALDRVRAWAWRVSAWEREAARRGDPAARPHLRPFYEALDRGDPAAALIWHSQLTAAVRHGFAKMEEAA